MKKQFIHRILSILAILIGFIFAICGVILQLNPLSRRSALLILSIVLILTGVVAFTVNYKKESLISQLLNHEIPIITDWTYAPKSSTIITNLIHFQKVDSIGTAALFLVLAIIFCVVFAYSASTYILYTGYILIFFCLCSFIVSLRLISLYYGEMTKSETKAIFGETCFYFLDELYEIRRGYHFLQNVSICQDTEDYLLFAYGLYDVDEPPAYFVTVPIPAGRMPAAIYLQSHYMALIKSLEL